MRKSLSKIAALLFLTVVMCLGGAANVYADDGTDILSVQYDVTYGQTEARTMLDMINEFRTGDETWYWNSDNTTKTTLTGLDELVYDYDLEQVAMQRAAEIAAAFSHTRPNGERCFTCSYNGTSSYGENICIGYGYGIDQAEEAFELWKEDNEDYSGQGHRRNMLYSDFAAVGIGHAYIGGCHYWVQEFSYFTSEAAKTSALDSKQTVDVDIATSQISSINLSASESEISIYEKEYAQMPTVSAVISLEETWPSTNTISATIDSEWSMADTSVAQISNGQIYGAKPGNTILSTEVNDQTVSADVIVNHKAEATVQENVVAATCTTDGSYDIVTYCSICGDELTRETTVVTAFGHSFSDWAVTTEATCTTDGQKERTCAVCGITETEKIEATGHNCEEFLTKATTSQDGKIECVCQDCGYVESSETIYQISSVTLSTTKYTYNGKTKKPAVTVKDSEGNKLDSSNYTLTYASGRKNVGKYTVKVTFQGNYEGTVTKTFEIAKASQTISASNKTIVIGSDSVKLGAELTVGNGTLSYTSSNKKAATISSSGKITPKGVGKTTITIKAKSTSNYKSATKTVTVTVIPKGTSLTSVKSLKNGQIIVKWSTKSAITGYRIRYSKNSDMSDYKTKLVTSKSTASKTITGLKKGKKYYVQVQTYKTVSGVRYYSKWSSKKSVTTMCK